MLRTGSFTGEPGRVCLEGADGRDSTLCGDAYEGWDAQQAEPTAGRFEAHKPRQPVTCHRCRKIVLGCRGVRVVSELLVYEGGDR